METSMEWVYIVGVVALVLIAVALIAWVTENKHSEEVGRLLVNTQYELQEAQSYITALELQRDMAANRVETILADIRDLQGRLKPSTREFDEP